MGSFFQLNKALTTSWVSPTPMIWSVGWMFEMWRFCTLLTISFFRLQGPCQNLTCFPPDVKCFGVCDVGIVTVPLMHNEVIMQQPVNFLELEKAYSDFAVNFITRSVKKNQPFFLYYPSHVSNTLGLSILKLCFQKWTFLNRTCFVFSLLVCSNITLQ